MLIRSDFLKWNATYLYCACFSLLLGNNANGDFNENDCVRISLQNAENHETKFYQFYKQRASTTALIQNLNIVILKTKNPNFARKSFKLKRDLKHFGSDLPLPTFA